MLDQISDKELDNPDLINGEAKVRIAKAAGKPVDEVNRLMHFYKQSRIIQNWLYMK